MILTGPATITAPGTYTFAQDIVSSQPMGIVVNAGDVVIDLNGFALRPGGVSGITTGISISSHAHRVQVTGGRITGFTYGLHNNAAVSTFLVDLDLSRNLYVGANLGGGRASTVRRVTCGHIGGWSEEAYAVGINGVGSEGVVEDCLFDEFYRQPGVIGSGEGVAILVGAGELGVRVWRNKIRNSRPEPNTIGVWCAEGSTGRVTDNVIHNFMSPIAAPPQITQQPNLITFDTGIPAPLPAQVFATMLVGSHRYEGYLPRVP